MNDDPLYWREILFGALLLGIISLKAYGLVKGKVPWYMIILLGAIYGITDPTPTAAATVNGVSA